MSFEFPLHEIETEFGQLPVPTIVLPVKTPDGYTLLDFLIDSGASFSMLPRPFAETLGVDLSGARKVTARGIGASGVPAQLAEITLRIGGVEFTIPCFFSSREDSPLLLGRMGLFSRFNITFDNRRRKIVLEEI
jgi:hypothetical protein